MKTFVTLAICAVTVFAPSLITSIFDVFVNGVASLSVNTAYAETVSAERIYTLSVESFRGLWGKALHLFIDIKDNEVPGWTHVYSEDGQDGFSYSIWQNNEDDSAYALVLAGTDGFNDFKDFLPMLMSETYSPQTKHTIEAAKNMQKKVPTNIEKLYVTGYSLGGYLASFLTTDLVDSSLSKTTHSSISVKDISSTLTLDNVKCYTFGAPGYYVKKVYFKKNADAKINLPDLGFVGFKTFPPNVTEWTLEKINNNKKGSYNNYVINYGNTFDPVFNTITIGEFFLEEFVEFPDGTFAHMGTTHTITPQKLAVAKINLLDFVFSGKFTLPNLVYHGPWSYIECIQRIDKGEGVLL